IYCACALDICEQRDVKGLYKKARAGEIEHFTGISSPYEEPKNPELKINTGHHALDECVDQVILFLQGRGIISL
ncbi:MAG: adenylyl-sulfate kinase, partial [Methyloprofundus sp.]